MNTPVYDFLIQYAERDPVRLHMPGHKGRFGAPALQRATTLDLTEITGADSLFEAEGILAESERNAASLYGTAYTFYSCGGSTLCIQTMLLLMKQQGRAVLAARNVHRAFLNACVLLDLPVQWIYPRESDGILSFLPWRCHPIQLGADYCCDSAHKMLSGLTGTAYLHVRSDIDVEPERVRDAMAMFGSTSPSYLMLASLDWCNRELASPLFRKQLEEVLDRIQQLKCRFSPRYCFVDGDPMHLTIDAAAGGFHGLELAAYLEQHEVFVEYADAFHVVLLCSAANTDRDFDILEQLLERFSPTPAESGEKYALPRPEKVCGIREAALAPQEIVPIGESSGRICAAVKVPCPPAVPIVLSGERIDARCIAVCEAYGITEISVVQ